MKPQEIQVKENEPFTLLGVEDKIIQAALETPFTIENHKEYLKMEFEKSEQLLLDEARQRFDFEQKSAATLHSKSTLFLSMVAIFAALLTASMGRLLDHSPNSTIEKFVLCSFLLSMGLLTFAAICLGRSALSRSYQVIATPSHWLKHLAGIRRAFGAELSPEDIEKVSFTRLRYDILDAWIEAAETSCIANESKAEILDLTQKLLYLSIIIAFLGVLLLILQKIMK